MPLTCLVCRHQASKYTCAKCKAKYCSVACYKRHKASDPELASNLDAADPQTLHDPTSLRPLTSLKWPYVPDTSAYPDPLQRDDPKPLQLSQYEAIAISPVIRTILQSNPRICDLLVSIDALRGADRDEALQRALGIDSRLLKNDDAGSTLDEDTRAFRALAEAVESAVRGGREDVLGLDWEKIR